jgi:ABC-type Fe3+-siderophore transport system permease subunit
MNYKERKEYLRRLDNAERVAVMLRGITLGCSFIVVMGVVAGVDSILKWLAIYTIAFIGGVSASLAEYFLFRASQSRYPKSRRQKVWELFNTELAR